MLNKNRLLVTIYDIVMVAVAWYSAYWLRFNLEAIPSFEHLQALHNMWLVIPAQVLAFFSIGIYRGMWRFASLHDLIKIVKAAALGSALVLLTLFFTQKLAHIPRSIIPSYFLILTIFLSSARVAIRLLLERMQAKPRLPKQRVLIVGAGSAGASLARDMLSANNRHFKLIAFIDDNQSKLGQEIHGIRVVGTTKDIPKIVSEFNIAQIVLALPSADNADLPRILRICELTKLPISTLPSLNQIVNGQVSVNLLRAISLEDLLGRDPVSLDWSAIRTSINDKLIMVTGAGGSIGSEVCRQIARLRPKAIIAIDHSEFNLFSLQQEFQNEFPTTQVHYHLVNIQDKCAIMQVLQTYKPELIFHAAAYKHVPLLQAEIREAVYNNVLGTYNLTLAAVQHQVKKFIMVSTDKAVNPQNIMGATKRIAEIICQSLNKQQSITNFITVRFGNVLGSAGSVVPIFRKQIEQGGPVTVTHPDITRFFMTIQEASQLILQALAIGDGGEIFVLDMGSPIRITLLAEQMIKLAGKKIGEDIKIKYTGLRPGEKLYEELFHADESLTQTSNRKIMQACSREYPWQKLVTFMEQIEVCCQIYDVNTLKSLINELVPEHNAATAIEHVEHHAVVTQTLSPEPIV